jgi:hypothetical protein
MGQVVIRYPHYLPSREPRPMKAAEIWRVAEAARRQLCTHPKRPQVEIGLIVTRCRRLEVNDLVFETYWECDRPVHDDEGLPVLGVTEHDSEQAAAMIYLNGELLQERDDLTRSTAIHELGHAVFDVPGWITRSGDGHLMALQERCFRSGESRPAARPIDWREWRANEFMGAFLAPRRLLHSHLVKRASSLGLPLVSDEKADELPVLRMSSGGAEGLETLAVELAETFGVSPGFIEVRLQKYGLLAGG